MSKGVIEPRIGKLIVRVSTIATLVTTAGALILQASSTKAETASGSYKERIAKYLDYEFTTPISYELNRFFNGDAKTILDTIVSPSLDISENNRQKLIETQRLVNILNDIYSADLNLEDAKPFNVCLDISGVTQEKVRNYIETAKNNFTKDDRGTNHEIEIAQDKVAFITQSIENELLTETYLNNIEAVSIDIVKILVADALKCPKESIRIPKRADVEGANPVVIVDETERYSIKAEDVKELINLIYDYQNVKKRFIQNTLGKSAEEKSKANEKMVGLLGRLIQKILCALVVQLSQNDHNLNSRHTTIEDRLSNLNFIAPISDDTIVGLGLGTDESKVYVLRK